MLRKQILFKSEFLFFLFFENWKIIVQSNNSKRKSQVNE